MLIPGMFCVLIPNASILSFEAKSQHNYVVVSGTFDIVLVNCVSLEDKNV